MIWFFTPYSLQKKLFYSIDEYMNLVVNPNHWVCLLDGDTAFLISNFGHQIQTYIDKYPDTGLFTSYASRCHYSIQVPDGTEMENPDLLYHKKKAVEIYSAHAGQVTEINRRIAGHLMLIKKSTWLKIRNEVRGNSSAKNILGVDTKISNAVLRAGLKIRLMKGIYLLHYLRLKEGFHSTNHIK